LPTAEADTVREPISHFISLALRYKCDLFSFFLDAEATTVPLIKTYRPLQFAFHIYARSLKEKVIEKPTMMYVDAVDL